MFDYSAKHPQTRQLLGLRNILALVFALWLIWVFAAYNNSSTTQKIQQFKQNPQAQLQLLPLPLPPIPATPTKVTTVQTQQRVKKAVPANKMHTAKQSVKQQLPTSKAKNQPTKSAQQVYQQLTEQGLDIQIAWPENKGERQAALNFIYQCAGAQFAVLNGNQVTKLKQVSNSRNADYSDWVRLAQGSLSKQERNLLNAYAVTGTPIRLFPRQIDWHLAQHLARNLKGQPLKSFKANYQVQSNRLQLKQISLNGHFITQTWQLFKGNC